MFRASDDKFQIWGTSSGYTETLFWIFRVNLQERIEKKSRSKVRLSQVCPIQIHHETKLHWGALSPKQSGMIITNFQNSDVIFIFQFRIYLGVRNGSMVKGWSSWSRDLGSIPSAGGHFWFGRGVPFILARSLQNWTKNTGGPLCVWTPHMRSKYPLLPLRKE